MPENTTTQLAAPEPRTVKDYLATPAFRDRFTEVLGKRANQFMASIVAVSSLPGLREASPKSIIAAAMVSATLDLPVNPTLGMAYVVAYKDKDGNSEAQFQIGYKGLIQLALRSGQYRRMNAGSINAEVFTGYDAVGEVILDFRKQDMTKPVGGYFAAFELTNGFTKVVYWPIAQVEAHAKKFSIAYKKGWKSTWASDFDAMATKTVIKSALTKWGILSVELQQAAVADQGVMREIGEEPKYIDAPEEVTGDAPPPTAEEMAAREKKLPAKNKGVNAMKNVTGTGENPDLVEKKTSAPADPTSAPAQAIPATDPVQPAGATGEALAEKPKEKPPVVPVVPQPEGWPKQLEGVITAVRGPKLMKDGKEVPLEVMVPGVDGSDPVRMLTCLITLNSPEAIAAGLGEPVPANAPAGTKEIVRLALSPFVLDKLLPKAVAHPAVVKVTVERWPKVLNPGQTYGMVTDIVDVETV